MGKSGSRKKKGGDHQSGGHSSSTASASAAAAANVASPGNAEVNVAVFDLPLHMKRAHELKEEGNRRFQMKEYAAALHLYELALKLIPAAHPDRAVFHSNRAACLMQMRPVDHEAVAAECSLALQAQPGFPRALIRRARALEALGRFDLAMRDVQTMLAADPDHRDALEVERRLRLSSAAAAGSSRPSPAALGASAVLVPPLSVTGLSGPSLRTRASPSVPPPKKPSSVPQQKPLQDNVQQRIVVQSPSSSPLETVSPNLSTTASPSVTATTVAIDNISLSRRHVDSKSSHAINVAFRPLKLVYDHDIRLSRMPDKCSFRELRGIVGKRFPSSKYVLIKYRDADGDLITITSTSELRLAESFVGSQVYNGGKIKDSELDNEDNALKLLRLYIVEVSPDQEPVLPDEEVVEEGEERKKIEEEGVVKVGESSDGSVLSEIAEGSGLLKANHEGEIKAGKGRKECCNADCKEGEIDDWLFEFAQLFRNQVGIDPDAHLDLHELGMDLCAEALEETVTSEAAQDLFEMAASKFQEVAALAFFNWGNVYMCSARKRIPVDDSSSKEVVKAQLLNAYDWVLEMYNCAQHKYEEALHVKPDFYEGLLALGQQHFETAKVQWLFALANNVDLTTWDSSSTIQLFNIAEEKMKAATEMWEKAEEQATAENKEPGSSKVDEILKRRRKNWRPDNDDNLNENSIQEAAEQAAVMRSQIHLFWGNMLYERSQVEFKLHFGDWEKNLDSAVQRFKLAGASESDIAGVLNNHASNQGITHKENVKKGVAQNGDAPCSDIKKAEAQAIGI